MPIFIFFPFSEFYVHTFQFSFWWQLCQHMGYLANKFSNHMLSFTLKYFGYWWFGYNSFLLLLITAKQAELQLNFQKRRGHGLLSVLRPKFSGVLGEALDVSARWSGDVVSDSFSVTLFIYLSKDCTYVLFPFNSLMDQNRS